MKLNLIVLILLASFAFTSVAAQKISKESIVSNGKKRAYYLYVPSTLKPGVAVPLVLLFHGSGRNGLTVAEKWKDLADREGLIIVAPDSLDSSSWKIPADGPAFLRELVDLMKGKQSINPKQVYLFGHSGGAKFAILMALYESEYFAASAVHAGSLDAYAQALPEQAKRKIPFQLQVGTNDPLFPLSTVRATRDLLVSHGFQAELIEIAGHDHWYYDRAPRINDDAWKFLKTHTLPTEPRFEEFRFKGDSGNTSKAVEHYMKGIQRHQATDRPGAIAAYTKAIELDGKFADAYNNRGVVHLEQQNADAALADFTRSLELGPSGAAYNNRANLYFSQKKFSESIKDYSAAIALEPQAEAYTNRGTAYWQTEQHELAFKDFDRAVEVDPKFGRAYLLRGLYYLRVGKSEIAQQNFDKGFALSPELKGEFDPIINSMRPRP